MKTEDAIKGHWYRLKIKGSTERVRLVEKLGQYAKVKDRSGTVWTCAIEQLEYPES